MRFLSTFFIALLASTALSFAADMDTMKDGVAQKEQAGSVVNIVTTLKERVMGDPAAPVTMIEYASLTCGHCAHFNKTILPELVKKYISTGKVKLIYRDFPLNALALKAAQVAQCMPEERYFPFVKTLFENMDAWTSNPDPEAALKQYARLAGLPGERAEACLNDKALQDALVKRRMEAEKQFKVMATPTFIIDYGKETISGAGDFAAFDAVLAKYVK